MATPIRKQIETTDLVPNQKPITWWNDLQGFVLLKLAYRTGLFSQATFFTRSMGNKHLEANIGSGRFLSLVLACRKMLNPHKVDIIGLDEYEPRLNRAMKRFKKNPRIQLGLGATTQTDFPSNSFDTVNMANALHGVPNLSATLCEIKRVLKPGGVFTANALLEPQGLTKPLANKVCKWGMKKGFVHAAYRKEELDRVLGEHGFSFLYQRVKGNTYNFQVTCWKAKNGSL